MVYDLRFFVWYLGVSSCRSVLIECSESVLLLFGLLETTVERFWDFYRIEALGFSIEIVDAALF